MPRSKVIQSRFTKGEFDPLVIGRSDIDDYYGGASDLTNVLTIPQGGVKRRPGLEHLGRVLGQISKIDGGSITETAPNGGTAANASDQSDATVVLTTVNISTTNPYVVIHYDLGSAQDIGTLYLNDAKVSSGTSTGEFYLQVSTDNSTWTSLGDAMDLTTTAKDFSRRVHGSYRYVRFARIGSTDLGTAKAQISGLDVATETGVSNVKLIDFEFNIDQTYKMVMSDKNLAIYQDDEYLIDIYISGLTNSLIPDMDWEFEADTLLLFHEDVQTQKLVRTGADDVWVLSTITFTNIPVHAFSGTSTSNPAFALGITGGGYTGIGATIRLTSSGNFTSAYLNQYINLIGTRRGRFFVKRYIDTSNIDGYVITAPDSTSSAGSGVWELESGYEPLWSVSRGWPRRGRFYQNRLWLDGGKSRPSVIYGSNVDLYFDFFFYDFTDDKAVGPLSGGFDPVEAIHAGRNLMVFTSKAEYIVPQTLGEPITPGNAALTRQSSIGSAANFRPQEFEGGVLYVQRGGASIQEFVFDDTQQAFGNNFISLLSSHLIDGPVSLALRKASSTEDGAYIMLAKSDGNLTMGNILQSQGIASFFEQTTDGDFIACGADNEDMYFVIQRVIDGNTINFLERFNNAHYMDASTRVTTGLPTASFSGLDHLEGEECRVLVDGEVVDNETVSGGAVTLGASATESFEIGLNFNPTITDLPYENPQVGSALGNPKNISEIILRVNETSGIIVNGKTAVLDTEPYTGVKRMYGWRGWNEGGQVTITQTDPLPMTILSVSKRINI